MALELEIWEGDWGLPSVDHQSLAVLAYCKFAKAPVVIKKLTNPWKSPSGEFPVLRHGSGVETKVKEIFNFLETQTFAIDLDLTSKENADVVAFSALMEEKLYPALLHLWWVDSRSYVELTQPWYSKRLPLVLCWYLPLRNRNRFVSRLELMKGRESVSDADQEKQIMKDAKECLNLLSSKLGDSNYFFGEKPTSFDALAFGYLSPLLKAPFPNVSLQNHLKGCRNLMQFCQRILSKYFPLSPEEQEKLRKESEDVRQQQTETTEFPHRRRNIVIAGVVVFVAMVGFALLNGIVQVEFIDVEQKQRDHTTTNVKQSFDGKEEEEEDEE